MTWHLTFTGYDQTRMERINHLEDRINYDSNQQKAEIEEILTAISILSNLSDEEYREEVDLTYDKFSEYLYIDSLMEEEFEWN
jgi:NTP pyrophosphatase (non-canonical NTP hydrolase)